MVGKFVVQSNGFNECSNIIFNLLNSDDLIGLENWACVRTKGMQTYANIFGQLTALIPQRFANIYNIVKMSLV